jgi:murein DD-endopeptidase MepM/ murein hydrolase activator NlpD
MLAASYSPYVSYTVLGPSTPAPTAKGAVGVVAEGKLTGKFGTRRSATHIHKGVDISAARGTPVRAVNRGQVVGVYLDGQRYGYGNSVLIRHPDGKLSFYAHLHTLDVRAGQYVAQGQKIGTVGSTQKRIRYGQIQPNPRPNMPPHLHMEIQTGATLDPRGDPLIGENIPNRIDPLSYMAQVGARPVEIERA